MVSDAGSHQWFALRVKARYEKLVFTVLQNKGYESFLPTYRTSRPSGRRSHEPRQVDVPMFPGYVFCRFNVLRRLPILMTSGVLHVVGTGRVPTPLDDMEVTSLQKALQNRLEARPSDFTQVGQKVRIVAGVLAGMEGTLADFKNSLQLILSITLLRRSVRVEMHKDWVTLCEPCRSVDGATAKAQPARL